MSGGLMSCVRENSPPLDLDASGPLSLPEPRINTSDLYDNVHSSSQQNIMSSTPLAAHSSSIQLDAAAAGSAGSNGGGEGVTMSTPQATPPNTEQQKRRRFHPLRNLRRIFRRRTITTATPSAGSSGGPTADTPTTSAAGLLQISPPAASSTSEKNLRSATLSSVASVASASSPSSPLTHQQLHDAYLTQSLPKSKSSYISLLGVGGKHNKSHDPNLNAEAKTKSKYKNKKQQQQQQQQQLQQQSKDLEQQHQQSLEDEENMFGTTTAQTTASYHQQQHQHHVSSISSTSSAAMGGSTKLNQRQSIGVAVFPGAMQRNFFAERQKLRSVGDSSQDLDSGSGNDSGTGGGGSGGGGHTSLAAKNSSASGGEMSDSQRSLSEGRLIDSDYSRDGLSQSHDSVFSESATASSLSIVLKAELADVLRKRRNRPDASDEDLGLPRSPASPQRRVVAKPNLPTGMGAGGTSSSSSLRTSSNKHQSTMEKHSENSSLSLLSMNSSADGEEMMVTSTANNSTSSTEVIHQERSRYSRSSTMSSISMSSDILRHRESSSMLSGGDEVDLFSSDWQRLSHSAAKHKMAIRPAKKKGGPSRQHRRTLETSIPEANEELTKLTNKKLLDIKDLDNKAKTRSLPPGVNPAKIMEDHTAYKETTNVTTKTSALTTKTKATATTTNQQQTTTTSSAPTTSATNNIFGFRSLSSKASALFESKESTTSSSSIATASSAVMEEKKSVVEVLKKTEEPIMEAQESGFLRRLMHRNSKRSIAKANAGDDQEQESVDGGSKPNEPKKMQMGTNTHGEAKSYGSTSNSSSFIQDVTQSEFSYISSPVKVSKMEENFREMKKLETISDSSRTANFSPMITTSSTSHQQTIKEEKLVEELVNAKPKTGPASRQRYLPQNISNENLTASKVNAEQSGSGGSKESILSKSSANDMFQSTSIIREITKQQSAGVTSPTKMEHHYEKKPKIVGLSAFQQKISKSSESFGRTSNNSMSSSGSLNQQTTEETSEELVEEVELCAPVRAQIYEQRSRKAVEKSKSFRAYGEEKPSITPVHNNMPSLPDLSLNLRVPYYKEFHESRESRQEESYFEKASPVSKITVSPSPMGSGKNLQEAENNIDMMVASPFISVIRKTANFCEQTEKMETTSSTKVLPVRPSVLVLKKERSLSEDNVLNSPSTANVTLREKSLQKQSLGFVSCSSSSGQLESHKIDGERKSAPNPITKTNGFRSNSTRRSSSVVDAAENKSSAVPEFMKIQLNRVDPMRSSKTHVVLSKNVKESSTSSSVATMGVSRESTPDKEDDFRRLSSESVDINERSSPELEKRFPLVYHEAINKQAKLSLGGLPPKSPIKKTVPGGMAITNVLISNSSPSTNLPNTPTTPPTPTINEKEGKQEMETQFKMPEVKSQESSNTNSLSLQERRRLFMSEDKSKLEKKVEEIKYERKRSINEELSRKTVIKSESMEEKESPLGGENCVILRKKSFASSSSHLSMNGGSSLSSSNNNSCSNLTKSSDPTPELMKVFARRSLKIKDEDLDKMLNNGVGNGNGGSQNILSLGNKKFSLGNNSPSCGSSNNNPSVDSDKENQSASEEKLDKLSKLEPESKLSNSNNQSNASTIINNQRNSLADFRQMPQKSSTMGLALNNSNNNNNNHINSPTNGSIVNQNNSNNNIGSSNKNFLPPIKITGFRHVSMERITNQNNTNNNICSTTTSSSSSSPAKSTTLERPSIKFSETKTETTTGTNSTTYPLISKTIERSATVGEFKGIHQRRAEWEQRAKEALK
ncbi:uncharacterized protein isoform X2 [Musca autumnalis]